MAEPSSAHKTEHSLKIKSYTTYRNPHTIGRNRPSVYERYGEAGTAPVVPLPPKEERVKGRRYFDRYGVARIWDGFQSLCAHDRQKTKCKDCGGSDICHHGKHKRQCKDCGGAALCRHKRIKSRCKECSGSKCKHGKLSSTCSICAELMICHHNKVTTECPQCRLMAERAGLCVHGRTKYRCEECSEELIGMCKHGKWRSKCDECAAYRKKQAEKAESRKPRPSRVRARTLYLCSHGNERGGCVQCLDPNLCVHGTILADCSLCKPPQICMHRIDKRQYCWRCDEAAKHCMHGRQKSRCRKCFESGSLGDTAIKSESVESAMDQTLVIPAEVLPIPAAALESASAPAPASAPENASEPTSSVPIHVLASSIVCIHGNELSCDRCENLQLEFY